MEKVFSGFRVNAYRCPETLAERTDMMVKINERISDLEQVSFLLFYNKLNVHVFNCLEQARCITNTLFNNESTYDDYILVCFV